jgi:hypothetical protein
LQDPELHVINMVAKCAILEGSEQRLLGFKFNMKAGLNKLKLLGRKFNLEAGPHSYWKDIVRKIYFLGYTLLLQVIRSRAVINMVARCAILEGDEQKLLGFKFIMEAGPHS